MVRGDGRAPCGRLSRGPGKKASVVLRLVFLGEANRSTFTNRRDYPTIGAGMIRDRGQDQAGKKRSGEISGWGWPGKFSRFRNFRRG